MRKMQLIYLTVFLIGWLSGDVYAQSTKYATEDVHNAVPYESLSTDWAVLGDPIDSTIVDEDSFMIIRNGTLEVRNKDTNALEAQGSTGLLNGAWVTKVSENTYYAGNGSSIMEFTFDPVTNTISAATEKYYFNWLAGDQRAGDYSASLGLAFIDNYNSVYRVNLATGEYTELFGGGYNMIKILEFQDGAYANNYMLQFDGEQFLNLDAQGNILGNAVIANFNNIYEILDMEYFSDKAIAIEKYGNQMYIPFNYQNNMILDPTENTVPEPEAMLLFILGIAHIGRYFRTIKSK